MVWLELFNFLHFIGLAFGVGGVTIAAIISAKAEKDKEIASISMKIISSISKLIWVGIFLLIISGIALPFLIRWPLNEEMLIVKHILVILVIIMGIILGLKTKKLRAFAPKPRKRPSPQFLKIKKQLKIFNTVGLVLWYIIMFLSVFM